MTNFFDVIGAQFQGYASSYDNCLFGSEGVFLYTLKNKYLSEAKTLFK